MTKFQQLAINALIVGLLLLGVEAPGQFIYTTNNGTLTAEQYTGSDANVVVPASVGGLPVVTIDNGCFSHLTNVVSLAISEGVENIAAGSCGECSGLANLNIPGTVTNIGDAAFFMCNSLTNVQIASGLLSIGDSAFFECDALANLVIPASVTNFDYGAFKDCTGLTNVTLENGAPGGHALAWTSSGIAQIYAASRSSAQMPRLLRRLSNTAGI